MNPFSRLQARHESLLQRQIAGEDILDDVLNLLEEIWQESGQVTDPPQRGQLRANLRYWAGYVHERTGAYPSTELLPATPHMSSPRPVQTQTMADHPRRHALIGALLLVALLGLWMVARLIITVEGMVGGPNPSPVPTELASRETEGSGGTASEPTEMYTPSPDEPDQTTPSPQASISPTPDRTGISAWTTTLQDSDVVAPGTLHLEGDYRNLLPDWSLHVLLQPVVGDGKRFPTSNFYTVPDGVRNGSWQLEVPLAPETTPSQYNLFLVVATNDAGRRALAAVRQEGLAMTELPPAVIPLPGVTTIVVE